jgi:hypothetical protein
MVLPDRAQMRSPPPCWPNESAASKSAFHAQLTPGERETAGKYLRNGTRHTFCPITLIPCFDSDSGVCPPSQSRVVFWGGSSHVQHGFGSGPGKRRRDHGAGTNGPANRAPGTKSLALSPLPGWRLLWRRMLGRRLLWRRKLWWRMLWWRVLGWRMLRRRMLGRQPVPRRSSPDASAA